MVAKTGDVRASVWVRGAGTVDEIGEIITTFLGESVPANPSDVYGNAESQLYGRFGSERAPGRALLWAAASMGSRVACRRLAEEIEAAIGLEGDQLPECDPSQAREIAETWRERGKGRLDFSKVDKPERRSINYAPPFPTASDRRREAKRKAVDGAGRIVIRSVGDVSSSEGTQLLSRFANVVDVALPAVGKLPPAGAVGAGIAAEWPWAAHVGERIEKRLSLLRSVGLERARLRPLLLVGPAGSGKTRLVRHIATALGLPVTVIPAAGSPDAASLAAVSRDWRNTRPCGPVIAAIESGCSNPAIIIDEIDKGVAPGSRNGSVLGTLLGMMGDPERYYDSCLMSEVDLSWVTFMATANDLRELPEPILDRFEIVSMGRPAIEHLPLILSILRSEEAKALGVHPGLLPGLDAIESKVLRDSFCSGMSLRALERAHRHMLGEAASREAALLPN